MIQLVADDAAGDRMVTRPGCARSPPTRRASAPAATASSAPTDAARRPSSRRRTAPRCRSSAGRCGRRTRSCPSTCGVGDAPDGLGDALAEARQLLALGVDGLITDSPDHAVQAVAELLTAV